MSNTTIIEAIAIAAKENARYSHLASKHNPMMQALIEHYAAFIENQTNVPAEETISALKKRAEELKPETVAAIRKAILDAVDDVDNSK